MKAAMVDIRLIVWAHDMTDREILDWANELEHVWDELVGEYDEVLY